MVKKGAKIFVVSLVLIFGFYFIMYYWGHMYGGRHYQRKVFDSEAKILLSDYHKEQKFYFARDKKFSFDLHSSKKYSEAANFKLGFNDNERVSKYCSECALSGVAYKIAAYSVYEGEDVVWTMDNAGNLRSVK